MEIMLYSKKIVIQQNQNVSDSYYELKNLLQKLYQEAVENKKSVQRQQHAIQDLYNLMNKDDSFSHSKPADLQEELGKIREYIEKTSFSLSGKLVEAIKDFVIKRVKEAVK
jgi:uncharacterized protein YfkK (UPF0435 family)